MVDAVTTAEKAKPKKPLPKLTSWEAAEEALLSKMRSAALTLPAAPLDLAAPAAGAAAASGGGGGIYGGARHEYPGVDLYLLGSGMYSAAGFYPGSGFYPAAGGAAPLPANDSGARSHDHCYYELLL